MNAFFILESYLIKINQKYFEKMIKKNVYNGWIDCKL